ncbi:unnamed protein product [Cladocopium goreaui]|uniref:ADP-ribosylation factor n=1 Tax=Cladocopium goreaui TaxID=2562237 RepID=A0A9P1G4V0_9DINO|nr:unnamed protein product [Cladocopium goreaui]
MLRRSISYILLGVAAGCADDHCVGFDPDLADGEAEVLKVSLLQTNVKTPSVSDDDQVHLFQAGDVNQGIWDTLGGMFRKAEKNAVEIQKSVLDTIVAQTDAALDDVDKVVNQYEADVEEAEMKFVKKTNASVMEQVQLIKKKVASVMDKGRAFWRNSKQQVVRIQNIVVGTLSTVGQTDTAIQINSTVVALLQKLDSASEGTLTVAKDARAVTAETASCAVLKLNSTLARASHEVESFTKDFEDVFKVTEAKMSDLSKKLPSELSQQALEDTIHKVLLALHRLQKVTKGTTPGSIQSIVLQLTPDGFAFCHKGGVDEGSQTWSHFQADGEIGEIGRDTN